MQGRAVPTADWPFAHAERLRLTIESNHGERLGSTNAGHPLPHPVLGQIPGDFLANHARYLR